MEWTTDQLYAQLYDLTVSDWPGEIDFYRALIAHNAAPHPSVLEVACGTGRVSLQLARDEVDVTGLDLSPELLAVAQAKSAGRPNIRWVQADMREFDLHQRFDLVISPGHSFQFMVTPQDQVTCLQTLKRHLRPGGLLVLHLDHQDVAWLGGLRTSKGGVFETGKVVLHPASGRRFRRSTAWDFDPTWQTASVTLRWEELDENENPIAHWDAPPKALHCAFRFEMEHLLNRVGLEDITVYGDFYHSPLTADSTNMVWLARAPE